MRIAALRQLAYNRNVTQSGLNYYKERIFEKLMKRLVFLICFLAVKFTLHSESVYTYGLKKDIAISAAFSFLVSTLFSVTFSAEYLDSLWKIPVIAGSYALATIYGKWRNNIIKILGRVTHLYDHQ